tara:strand:- start:4053 stop:5678 length:1626 start_codon:yes stop_codon:yes gene_type:complete
MAKWFTESDLRDADLIWLLTLTLGGVVYRFATESISIDSDGSALDYDGTLTDVSFSTETTFATSDFDLPSASVTVTFAINLAKLISQGVDFGSAKAELALFRKDSEDDFDDRQTIVSGSVQEPSYGGLGEPVSFNIEPEWLRNTQIIPAATAVVDSAVQFGDCDDNCEGAVYPLIIGAPGRQEYEGSPMYVVDSTGSPIEGMVAGHPCTATNVDVLRIKKDGDTQALSNQPLVTATDSLGQQYLYVNLAGYYAEGDSYFAKWTKGGGGIFSPFGIKPPEDPLTESHKQNYLTGGGDLVRYFLHQSGAKVDDGRCAAAAKFLNFITFDFYLSERVDAMEFLRDEILPLLPCSLRATADGIYPVVWRYDATEEDSKTTLTANVDLFRTGPVEYSDNEIYNEISIRYRHNARFNKLTKTVTISGDQNRETHAFLWRSDYTVFSYSRFGTKALEVETELIGSRASAGRVINWMSRAYASKHRVVAYEAPYKLAWIEPGDIVALTDEDLFFETQIVIVQSIEWGDTGLLITFLLIPDLPRDTIPTG